MNRTTMHGLTFKELLDYTTGETERWRKWLAAQPAAVLDLPAGSGRTATVGGLVHHIIAVEIRYIDRLRSEPVTPYDEVPRDPAALFAAFAAGRQRLTAWLATATDEDMIRVIEFQTMTAGTGRASARKLLAHLMLHGIRHWAQLATVVRQHGVATDWPHDILVSDAVK